MTKRRPILFVRADASVSIGIGHVMRCFALSQAWKSEGGEVRFISSYLPGAIAEKLRLEGFGIDELQCSAGSEDDAGETAVIVARSNALLVLDGYNFDLGYQSAVKAAADFQMVVDDFGRIGRYRADFILDQNLGASAQMYANRSKECRLLLGPRYALIREEFLAVSSANKLKRGGEDRTVKRVLVLTGGGDPRGLIRAVIVAMTQLKNVKFEVRIVIGPAASLANLSSEIPNWWDDNLQVLRNPDSIADLMNWADIAVSAAGSTCLELCCLGVPTISVPLVDSQRLLGERLSQAGVTLNVETEHASHFCGALAEALRSLIGSPDTRHQVAVRGAELIDGSGAKRVATELFRTVSGGAS